jgi:ketosteroid isomerase-like protein
MSEDNVELVRALYDGWARGDFRRGAELLAPDFEWLQLAGAVEPGSHRGAQAVEALRRIFEMWADFSVRAEEFIDAGEKVVVVARTRGIDRDGRADLDQVFAYVWTVRGGRLARNEVFADRAIALQAAGLADA